MGKRARHRQQRRARALRTGRPYPPALLSLHHGAIEPASCPTCFDIAVRGGVVLAVGDEGDVRELDVSTWAGVELIEVTVRGDASLWPLMPFEPQVLSVPAGCDVENLVQFIYHRDPALARAAEADGVIARRNGGRCTAADVLDDGDTIDLTLAAPEPRLALPA